MISKVVHFQTHKSAQPVLADDATLEMRIIAAIRTVYDPEIPVNLYDLGLIYDFTIGDDNVVNIDMTLTAPACPVAGILPKKVECAVRAIDGVQDANVNLVWHPPWTQERMTDEARLELGLL